MSTRPRWNHNIHYWKVVLDAMPERCERALDVGCGEGALARRLRRSIEHVSAIDRDEDIVEAARRLDPALLDRVEEAVPVGPSAPAGPNC